MKLMYGLVLWGLVTLTGCAYVSPNYEHPNVELTSVNMLPPTGFEQNFEVGLKLINPNNFELPLNGISYRINLLGETLAQGVTSDIPTVPAYGESRFTVSVSTSLIGGLQVIKALMNTQGQDVTYQLEAKLDVAIPLVPNMTVTHEGVIPFN